MTAISRAAQRDIPRHVNVTYKWTYDKHQGKSTIQLSIPAMSNILPFTLCEAFFEVGRLTNITALEFILSSLLYTFFIILLERNMFWKIHTKSSCEISLDNIMDMAHLVIYSSVLWCKKSEGDSSKFPMKSLMIEYVEYYLYYIIVVI